MVPKKILIVEDSDLVHKVYDVILARYRAAGAKVLHSFNGQEALSLLVDHPDVDLILLDINMPIMSGLEFLTRLRREPVFQGIAVIIVSTEGKEEDTIRALETGATGYITKPFQANAVHALIERISAGGAGAPKVEPR